MTRSRTRNAPKTKPKPKPYVPSPKTRAPATETRPVEGGRVAVAPDHGRRVELYTLRAALLLPLFPEADLMHSPGPWRVAPGSLLVVDRDGMAVCDLDVPGRDPNRADGDRAAVLLAPDLVREGRAVLDAMLAGDEAAHADACRRLKNFLDVAEGRR